MIKEKINWEPTISIRDGMKITHKWIKERINFEILSGVDVSIYSKSTVVVQTTESLEKLNSIK